MILVLLILVMPVLGFVRMCNWQIAIPIPYSLYGPQCATATAAQGCVDSGMDRFALCRRKMPASCTPSGRMASCDPQCCLLDSEQRSLAIDRHPGLVWAAHHALGWRPGWLSGGLGLIADILVLDMLIYWWHRLNHEIPFLWRFHEVHHLDEFLDVSSAVRFHFGEVLLSAGARAVIIILLGIPFTSVIVFESLVILSALFHHSNLKLGEKLESALARVIVTPSIHWVHHHAIRADTDLNYATLFSWWDLVFRSRSATRRRADMKIGVENRSDEAVLPLIVMPFRNNR